MKNFSKFRNQELTKTQAENIKGGKIYHCHDANGDDVSIMARDIQDLVTTMEDLGLTRCYV
jgi:hypothetical protein